MKGNLNASGENTENYITFSVPIKKKLDNSKTITWKLTFVDSFRFMSTALSSLADNVSEIYNKKCINKSCKSECEFIKLKNNRLQYKCYECKKIQLKPINELIKKFPKTYRFCNRDINKFILLLRKGVHPYEYMDSWGRFNETNLLNKKPFYSELNLEDITNKDYVHAQKVFEEFKLKNLDDYHDLYVQSDTLLLADVFENFIESSVLKYMNSILLNFYLH